MSKQINLVPEVKRVYLRTRKLKWISTFFLVSISLVSGVVLTTTYNHAYVRQKETIDNYQKSINDYVEGFNNEEYGDIVRYINFQNQFRALEKLIADRPDGSRVSKFLKEFLTKNQYESISSYNFDFAGRTFLIDGRIPKDSNSQSNVNFSDEVLRGHFENAYFEERQVDNDGKVYWRCPDLAGVEEATSQAGGSEGGKFYCPLFPVINISFPDTGSVEPDADKSFSIQGQF